MAWLRAFALSLSCSLGLVAAAQAQATEVYWSFRGDTLAESTINRAAIDGTAIERDLVTGVRVSGIAINPIARTMYIADYTSQRILLCNLDGTSCTPIVENVVSPGDVDIDLAGERIYWANFDDGRIRSARLDGTDVRTVWDHGILAYGLALDLVNRYVYWSGPFAGADGIVRGRLDGLGSVETVLFPHLSMTGSPRGLAVDPVANLLYFTVDGSDRIYELDLSSPSAPPIPFPTRRLLTGGSGGTPGLAAMDEPWDIELDPAEHMLYWTASTGVWRARTDGTLPEELITGPFIDDENHFAIALRLPILDDGAPCASPDLCLHRLCVDGVCCASACEDYCMSCNGDDTGMESGTCRPITVPNREPLCSDPSDCTDDLCTTAGGCTHVEVTGACEDGDVCTEGDSCESGVCIPGEPVCDAGPPDAGFDAGMVVPRDAGARDASVPGDGGVTFDAGADPGGDGGCGCRASGGGPSRSSFGLLGVVAAGLLGARRGGRRLRRRA